MRAVMAFLTLGRLRSHPGLENGLRTRFPRLTNDAPNSSEQTAPRWKEIRPKGRPVETPYPQRTNQRTRLCSGPRCCSRKRKFSSTIFRAQDLNQAAGAG